MAMLESTKANMWVVFGVVVVATAATLYAPYPDGAGMTLLIMAWLPLIVGMVTVIFYFLTDKIAGRFAWLATAAGTLFLLVWTFLVLLR